MTRSLLGIALALLLPASAAAHGAGHGGPTALAAAGAVSIAGYRVELLSQTGPLMAGREARLLARVSKPPALDPVSEGRILIGLAPDGTSPAPVPALEETWAGHYTAVVTPVRLGGHQVRVVLVELEGRRLEPPVVVAFPVAVIRAPGMGAAAWALIALLGGLAALALYLVALRARLGPSERVVNLLDIGWFRRMLTSRAFQPALQIPLLALTAVVVMLGLHDVQDGSRNVATRLTWTLWWTGVIFTFVLAGRVWCLACPFGALNEWTARLMGAWRRLPPPFRNIWWATGMFVALTLADEQFGVVRSPRVTAWLLGGFAGLAVLIGLVYERRSFCRHLCPIGGLIGIYSMTAPVELRVKDVPTCRVHAEKTCYRGGEHSDGCPMFEFPHTMDRNNYCTFCAQCVRGCERKNLSLHLRTFGRDLWASRRRVLDESYLAVALVGLTILVTTQMLTAWPGWIAAVGRGLPAVVRATLKPVTYLSLVESVIVLGGSLVATPLLALGGAALGDRLAGAHRLGTRRAFVVFGYMFVPVGLAVHLAHNLEHLLAEGGGIVPALQRAVAVYTPWSLGDPDWRFEALAPEPVVAVLQVAVVVGFFVLSLIVGHRLSLSAYDDPRAASRALIPLATLSFAFTVIALVLLQQPMGMRHGM